jgi:hypothetical protein
VQWLRWPENPEQHETNCLSVTRNVQIEPEYWDRLEGARTIPVIYVPDEPGISRLARGEVTKEDFSKTLLGGYIMSALCGLMGLGLLGFAPFAWRGYDLTFDAKTKKWALKRLGKVVWSSQGGEKVQPPWAGYTH